MVVSEVWIWCPSIRFSLSLSLNKYKTIKYDVDSADVIVYLIYFVSFCFGYPFGRIVDGSVRYRCAVCMILPVFGSSMSISNVCYTLFRLGNLEPNRTANDENEKKLGRNLISIWLITNQLKGLLTLIVHDLPYWPEQRNDVIARCT